MWRASLLDGDHQVSGKVGGEPLFFSDVGECAIIPQIGITSTPAIGLNAKPNPAMFVVSAEQPIDKNGAPVAPGGSIQMLHKLDIGNGLEEPGWPVEIQGAVLRSGKRIAFNPDRHLNRPGLLLSRDGSTLYVAFGSHCDVTPYHGWVFAYDANTGKKRENGIFVTTPGASGADAAGGIWMSGAGLSADDADGDVFLVTGNGAFDSILSRNGFPLHCNFGNSIIKLAFSDSQNCPGSPAASLTAVDYFTPFDQARLNNYDLDLGSGGIALLPDEAGIPGHSRLLVHAGKDGAIRLLDRGKMARSSRDANLPERFCASCNPGVGNTNIVAEFQQSEAGQTGPGGAPKGCNWEGFWGTPTYWNHTLYFWATGDALKAFELDEKGQLKRKAGFGPDDCSNFPGAGLSVSSDEKNQNGIVWALRVDGVLSGKPAVLKAYDAVTGSLLYSSDQNEHDSPGMPVKFTVPTIANGKVYVGAADRLSVFGIDPPPRTATFSTGCITVAGVRRAEERGNITIALGETVAAMNFNAQSTNQRIARFLAAQFNIKPGSPVTAIAAPASLDIFSECGPKGSETDWHVYLQSKNRGPGANYKFNIGGKFPPGMVEPLHGGLSGATE